MAARKSTSKPCGCEVRLDPKTGRLTIVCCSYEHLDEAQAQLEAHRHSARSSPPPIGPKGNGFRMN